VALLLRESLGENADDIGTGAEYFKELPLAFFTMVRCIVAGECNTHEGKPIFVLVSSCYGWGYGAIYCFTVVLMTFGLFNVIVAIFVENTLAAAKYNDARQKRQRLMDQHMFTERAVALVEFIWRTHTGEQDTAMTRAEYELASQMELTPEFFEELRHYKEFQEILRGLDVADEDQLDLFDTLDVDGGGTIDVDELVKGIAKLRGDARRSDIVGVSLMMRSVQMAVTELSEVVSTLRTEQQELSKNITDGSMGAASSEGSAFRESAGKKKVRKSLSRSASQGSLLHLVDKDDKERERDSGGSGKERSPSHRSTDQGEAQLPDEAIAQETSGCPSSSKPFLLAGTDSPDTGVAPL